MLSKLALPAAFGPGRPRVPMILTADSFRVAIPCLRRSGHPNRDATYL
jgi:hypothetical protein